MNTPEKQSKLAKVSDDTTVTKEIVHVVKQSKPLQKLIVVAVICLVFLVILLAVWIAGRNSADGKADKELTRQYEDAVAANADLEEKYNELETLYNELINTPDVVVSVQPQVVEEIIRSETNDISQLATAEYLFTHADKYSDSQQIKNWNIPLTQKSFIIRYDGILKAGIDLNKVTVHVDDAEKVIKLTVPRAEFLSYEIDNDSTEVLDEKNNIFNKISIEDHVKLNTVVEAQVKERALDNGLLDKAQENAANTLTSMLLTNPDIKSYYTIEVVVNE